jgi:uncharacterized membrane protein
MNTRRLLIFSWSITAILLFLTVGAFVCNFWRHGMSNDPAQWGHVGDYFGGVLNPFISLISLIVLTYISIAVSKIEDQRNEFTLQELARPLGQIICGDYEDQLEIKFKNCGLGPLIIKEIIILKNNQKVSNNLIKLMLIVPIGVAWNDFIIDGVNFTVAKDTEINVILIKGNIDNSVFNDYKTRVRNILKEITIEVKYVDIYDRPMKSAVRNLDLFGRTLDVK